MLLVVATVALAMKARAQTDVEVTAYVTGTGSSVYLREGAGEQSQIVTILSRGTVVRIRNSTRKNSQDWYYVKTDDHSGWILAENVSLDPP